MKIVILAAGFGSRLWPLSVPHKPKQFQPIIAQQSPLGYTYQLFTQVAKADEIYVLTLQGLEQQVKDQLPEITAEHIICVPERRNTFPHVLFVLNSIPIADDEPLLFTTVDHLIVEPEEFVDSLKQVTEQYAHNLANVTLLGNRSEIFDPNAGYFAIDETQRILSFKEKPEQKDIESLGTNGSSPVKDTAMFISSRNTFAAALATFSGDESVKGRVLLTSSPEDRNANFLAMPFIDIATGFYEKATNLQAAFTAGDFIDLGSFDSLYKLSAKDERGNALTGNVIADETSHNNYAFNQTAAPLVVIGMSDSVIVQNDAGTVIAPKSSINRIGEIYKSQIYTPPGS